MSLSSEALVALVEAKNHLRIDAAADLIVWAEYIGVGDGSDTTFSLDNTPIEGSVKLYVNNVLQTEGSSNDYTISGGDITFVTAPTVSYQITAYYEKAASSDTFESYDDNLLENLIEAATKRAEDYTGRAFIQRTVTEQHTGNGAKILKFYKRPVETVTSVRRYHYERVGTGDGSTVAFTLDNTPITGTVTVYKNGVLQTVSTHYTISGVTITFIVAPGDDARITANYKTETDFIERLNIGRLYRDLTWIQDYIYEVVYTAGYASTRAATQILVPEAVSAVLLMVAYLYENRVDMLHGENIAGVGSVTYELPLYADKSGALTLLNPLRVNIL